MNSSIVSNQSPLEKSIMAKLISLAERFTRGSKLTTLGAENFI